MKKNKIVLTGGGTTGHVSVNLALIPKLLQDGWDVHYIGSKKGIERDLIQDIQGVTYHSIATGKLRRYLSLENIKDFFKVILGTIQATFKVFTIKPNVAFSKGGFVSVPVLVATWINRVPALTHESDLTPGLANKLVQPFVKTVFTTFEDTSKYIRDGKGTFLGPVIREDLKGGDRQKAIEYLGIKNDKPVLLSMGGSLGSKYINDTIRENLDNLLENFNIIHATGKGNIDPSIAREGYYQFEYIKGELKDILALADLVITRSGSNAIFEFLYYKIPMILIPLKQGSRGDQIDNAKNFEKHGYAVLVDEDSEKQTLLNAIDYVNSNSGKIKSQMNTFLFSDTVQVIYDTINKIKK